MKQKIRANLTCYNALMMVFEVLQTFFVALITAYLALTNTLVTHIESYLPETLESHTEAEPEAPQAAASEALVTLSRLYATTAGATKILLEDTAFQDALKGETPQSASVIEAGEVSKEQILQALVNILCEYRTDEYVRTTTGTGFFVNKKGVILTNAHVAQFLLLESAGEKVKDAHCIIRSGNPATPRYTAELLFISPTWILKNAELITSETPQGTGEYDYALLYVSGVVGETELPSSFPTLPLFTEYLPKSLTGSPVLLAGYPAEKILREGAGAELLPKIAESELEELYTFGSNYADIFLLKPSLVGEQGASGGPVVEEGRGAIGLIVTKGNIIRDGETSLRALTVSYIDRIITEETGFSLTANLEGNLVRRGEIFKKALVPYLAQLLSFELTE